MRNTTMETDLDNKSSERSRLGRYKKPERSAVGICTKYTLFFENFFMVFLGMGLTALGTYILVIKEKKVNNVLDFFLDPACDMCLAGSVIFFMGFLGCMGSLREITCFLKTYYFFLCLFLLAELLLAVLMFVAYSVPSVKDTVFPTKTFRQAITNYRDDPDLQHVIDTLQQDLECCGLSNTDDGFLDWNDNMYFNCTDQNLSPEKCSVPYSCCRTKEGDNINYQCGSNVMEEGTDGEPKAKDSNLYRIYTKGCVKALGDWINDHSLIVGGVMLGILVPQVIVVILARNLIDMINAQKSRW